MQSTVIEPIGTAARIFLRRVRFMGEPMQVQDDEFELAMTCISAGYMRRNGRIVDITETGIAYLDRLARCE